MVLTIPYVEREIAVEIPRANLAFDLSPALVQASPDPAGEICQALNHPFGTPPLRSLAKSGQRVVIIADDNTRFTPVQIIIPLLLDEINSAGVPDANIQVIIASGTHRPMTAEEIQGKYGSLILRRVQVVMHDYKDQANLVDYGTTRRGTRVIVNKQVVEADLRIGVGSIIPHHPTGWGGGAKIVLPGVAGEETVAQMHLLGSSDPHLGDVDTEMRREMEDFAAVIGLNFIVNTIMNSDGELIAAFAGHFLQAHRAGVARAMGVFGVPFTELADLTISSTSPVDFDFFQADKGIFAAELATRRHGEIVLMSGCTEGLSGSHSDLADYGNLDDQTIWEHVKSGKAKDPLTAAEALALNHIKRLFRVTVVSDGFTARMAQDMGYHHVDPGKFSSYLSRRLSENPNIRLGVLRRSAEILPQFTG